MRTSVAHAVSAGDRGLAVAAPRELAWERARRALGEFIDAPSSHRFNAVRDELSTYLADQRRADLDPGAAAHLEELGEAFNTFLWSVPGSGDMQREALRLRHALLRSVA